MKIKIWGDFACPFCYMGENLLEKVLGEMPDGDKVEIDLEAYELDPKAPAKPVQTMTQHFMSEHNETEEEAEKQIEHIVKIASRLGLVCNLKDAKVCSTLDAHRLIKYAKEHTDSATVMKLNLAIFNANFVDNKLLSDRAVLADLAESVGLDRAGVEAMFASDQYIPLIRQDEEELNAKKFDYIPYMLFDDDTVLQGVISVGALRKALSPLESKQSM